MPTMLDVMDTETRRGRGRKRCPARRERRGCVAFALAACITVLPACSAADPASRSGAADAAAAIDPVFDCYAANSAWGLAYSGKAIDRAGRIWTYRRSGSTLPRTAHEGGAEYLEAGELAAKFAGAEPTGRVGAAALAAHVAQIEEAVAGKVEKSDTGVRDAGTSTCHAYLKDDGPDRYRDVMLGSDGGVADVRFANDAPAARKLLDWLRSVGVAR